MIHFMMSYMIIMMMPVTMPSMIIMMHVMMLGVLICKMQEFTARKHDLVLLDNARGVLG